jgi:peptidoglycan hydrolase-like protein with peptidoglycan-binding domain
VLQLQDHTTLPYRHITVERGDNGGVVATAQELLGVTADGVFGPQSEQAVRKAQQRAGLATTGVIDGPTWAALDPGRERVKAIEDLRGGRVEDSTVRD